MDYKAIIEQIKTLKLGSGKAIDIYNDFCACLREKYGAVDKDYDDNPTRRGKEWLDIHHVLEYELDDIANRTNQAIYVEKAQQSAKNTDMGLVVMKSKEYSEEAAAKIFKGHTGNLRRICLDYSLEDLKPYNVKEKLIFANKIEHFLLHYLIASIRTHVRFSGGTNYLWDDCISLEVYWSDKPYIQKLIDEKETFYTDFSPEDITILYKKLIDWKKWSLSECRIYWKHLKYEMNRINGEGVTFIYDKQKLFHYFSLINFALDEKDIKKINNVPFKEKIILIDDVPCKQYKHNIYSLDGKTIVYFHGIAKFSSFTVPENIEYISSTAFYHGFYLENITIHESVKTIADNAFTYDLSCDGKTKLTDGNTTIRHCPFLKTVYYKGSREDWEKKFSNVDLTDITLVCKVRSKGEKVYKIKPTRL